MYWNLSSSGSIYIMYLICEVLLATNIILPSSAVNILTLNLNLTHCDNQIPTHNLLLHGATHTKYIYIYVWCLKRKGKIYLISVEFKLILKRSISQPDNM